MGSETSIIKETPQRKGLSLKWKWALGSAAGVFFFNIYYFRLVHDSSIFDTDAKD